MFLNILVIKKSFQVKRVFSIVTLHSWGWQMCFGLWKCVRFF